MVIVYFVKISVRDLLIFLITNNYNVFDFFMISSFPSDSPLRFIRGEKFNLYFYLHSTIQKLIRIGLMLIIKELINVNKNVESKFKLLNLSSKRDNKMIL